MKLNAAIFFAAAALLIAGEVAAKTEPKREPRVDFTKPMYLKAGAVACPTMDELSLAAEGAPTNCGVMKKTHRAYFMTGGKAFFGIHKVRIAGPGGQAVDVFVTTPDLTNTPPN